MKLRLPVLLPPLIPLLAFVIYGLYDAEGLLIFVKGCSDWLLDHFDWLFSWSIFGCFVVVLVVYFSPLGKVVIGGEGAKPLLSPFRWFAVTVCTTIATGILFWGTAEPIMHASGPPPAGVADPEIFAMSTLFLHWTFTPYGMYTLGGLIFALAFYNRKEPFAISALLAPALGRRIHRFGGSVVDAICLFALVAGMAASLGVGALSLVGGSGLATTPGPLAVVIGLIVVAFSISAATGLQQGIRLLSGINVVGFMILAIFVLLAGPTLEALQLSWAGTVDYVATFLPRNLGLDPGIPKQWQHDWSSFYWANWFAWAPISALFLGRLGVGYTVRHFIRVNLVYTALFGAFWMLCFGAIALVTDSTGTLTAALQEGGAEAVIYALLDTLPLAKFTPILFLVLVFLSYVTAADSNVSAMSALCVSGINPEQAEAPLYVKLLWGGLIGGVSWVLVAYAGLDGVRLISTLGGFLAMFLLIIAGVGLLRMAVKGGG
ncbi:MAG: BCCT family transporter [Bacteroidota bacterium]